MNRRRLAYNREELAAGTNMSTAPNIPAKPSSSFRLAVWQGLGVVLPPLLTIVILFWIGSTVKQYFYDPVMAAARQVLYLKLSDIRTNLVDRDPEKPGVDTPDGVFVAVDGRNFVPLEVVEDVQNAQGAEPLPTTAAGMYRRYIEVTYLKPLYVVPIFLLVLLLILYLLGKLLAISVGRFFWSVFEKGVDRLPLVNSVYSSVKQVTDLMFNEHEIKYTRIVAIEFPSKGMWSVGFVTSEGLLDIEAAANEPVVAVLVPYAPLPVTGVVVVVRKSETVDLNITLDQAFQFIVSCGVVVPQQQISRRAKLTLVAAGSNGAKLEGQTLNALVEQVKSGEGK